jgi:hypothetical protein
MTELLLLMFDLIFSILWGFGLLYSVDRLLLNENSPGQVNIFEMTAQLPVLQGHVGIQAAT